MIIMVMTGQELQGNRTFLSLQTWPSSNPHHPRLGAAERDMDSPCRHVQCTVLSPSRRLLCSALPPQASFVPRDLTERYHPRSRYSVEHATMSQSAAERRKAVLGGLHADGNEGSLGLRDANTMHERGGERQRRQWCDA